MSKELITRFYEFDVNGEAEESTAILTGRPIVYNSRTDLGFFDEVIDSGALNNTDLTDVRFLVNHDTSKIPLARSRRNNGSSTMQLSVDEGGMAIRAEIDIENNAEARSLYSAVKRGDVTGMSFMFSVNSDEWDDLDSEHPTRHIRSIGSVVEVSAVTFPAYESTEINARSKAALENARSAVETARQQSANPVETGRNQLALEKAKYHFREIF